jgi:hypothetical protein
VGPRTCLDDAKRGHTEFKKKLGNVYRNLVRNRKVKRLGDVGLDKTVLLKWVLKKQDIRTLSGTEYVLVVVSCQRGKEISISIQGEVCLHNPSNYWLLKDSAP